MDNEEEFIMKLRRFPGSHLSAPLTYYPQRLIIKHFESRSVSGLRSVDDGVKYLNILLDEHPDLSVTEDPSKIYAIILASCYQDYPTEIDRAMVRELALILECAVRDTSQSLEAIQKQNPGLSNLKLAFQPHLLQELKTSLYGAYSTYKSLTSLKSSIQRKTISTFKKMDGPFSVCGMTIYFIGETIFAFYKLTPSKCAVMNYDQLVMLCDTVASRLLTMITCGVNDHYKLDILPPRQLLIKIYQWGDEMIRQCHMNAYSVIGEYESIITSVFVTFTDADPLGLGNSYGDSIMATAEEIQREYQISVSWTIDILLLLKTVTSANILSELFGIRKHWGVPMVEATASGESVQDKLNEDLPVSGPALLQLSASFNRMITLEYIRKNHRWPKCELDLNEDGGGYPLYKSWKDQITRIPEDHPNHRHLDWAKLRFHANCTIDPYSDQLSTLADKSVSLPVNELDSIYFRPRDSSEYRRSEHERRLLLEYLRDDHLTVMEILQSVMRGDLPSSWFANSAAMKGTELKHKKARIFAVLTFELRQFFSITESIIKDHLFPYNPHQTMTLSEVDLLQKLREITKQMDVNNTSRVLNVMHIIDFSKWNLRMRYCNTCLIFKAIDDFLGLPALVERSHHLFEGMVNLIQDAYNPPSQSVLDTESSTIWRLHNRGWEGQRQKGWTLLTSALLADIERQTGIHSEICGQGDNQTLLSQFPIPNEYANAKDWVEKDKENIRRVLDEYYSKLETSCSAIGLKMKTAESCRSLHYLNYGKRLYFNGSELSMTLKRISKAMTESNDAFPTTESKLKTSQGSAYTAGLYSNPSPWPYFMSRICTLLSLTDAFNSNPLIGDSGRKYADLKSSFTIKFLSILSKIPPSLGGPSQQSFAAYLCRGHPDPLSEDLVMLTLKAQSGCEISRSIIRCARSGRWFNPESSDKSSLILSPYSLNIVTPTSARLPLSKAVLPALIEYCKNKSVKPLLSVEMSNYEDQLLEALSLLQPFNPLVANDLYSRSIPGQRQSFIAGLRNATSLCRLVVETTESPIINEIMVSEYKQLQFWVEKVNDIVRNILPDDKWQIEHHTLASELREYSWGIRLVGVTVPHPLELFSLVSSPSDLCKENCQELNPEHLLVVRHSDELFSPEGTDADKVQLIRSRTGRPYLGSTIREGIMSRQMICNTPTRAWQDACRLNILRQWVSAPGSILNSLISHIISTRTDAPLPFLSLVTGHPSRLSYSHRASLLSVKKTCSITSTSNMMSRIYISSNRMGEYSSGDVNYHLPYGPSFIIAESLVCLNGVMNKHSWSVNPHEIFHYHLTTTSIPVVYDGDIECSSTVIQNQLICEPPNQLFTSTQDLSFEDLAAVRRSLSAKSPSNSTMLEARIAYSYILLADSFIREILAKELSSTTLYNLYPKRATSISVGDLKLATIPCIVKVISFSLILVCEPSMHRSSSREAFSVMCKHLLDGFSKGFWSQFTNAMLHRGVVQQLILCNGGDISGYASHDLSSLNSILKAAVISESWRVLSSFRSTKMFNNRGFVILGVPNIRVARYLLAKYVEASIIGMIMSNSNEQELDNFDVKEVSSQMYRLQEQDEELSETFAKMNLVYSSLVERYNLTNWKPSLPWPTLMDLSYPWIDKLRESDSITEHKNKVISYNQVCAEHLLDECTAIILGEQEVGGPIPGCRCDLNLTDEEFKTEFFFLRRGSPNPNRVQVNDTLTKHKLCKGNLIVLGDEDGDISYDIANNHSVNHIYIAGTKKISDCDPHIAGSYLPSAFVMSDLADKIVYPSQAFASGNPLESTAKLTSMIEQLSELSWQGLIICPTSSSEREALANSLLRSLLEELHMSSIQPNWVLVNTKVKCWHELAKLITAVGSHFSHVSVCKPVFMRPSVRQITLVGQGPRSNPVRLSRDQIFLSLMTNSLIKDVFEHGRNASLPPLFQKPKMIQREWVSSQTGEDNLRSYCDSYLPGWGTSYHKVPSISQVKDDLKALRGSLRSAASNVENALDQIKQMQRIPRTRVLILGVNSSDSEIQSLSNKWLRSLILDELLSCTVGDLQTCSLRLSDLLQRQYTLKVSGRVVRVMFQAGAYRRYFSGALWGILGHLWQDMLPLGDKFATESLHLSTTKQILQANAQFPIILKPTYNFCSTADLRFMWIFRSKICAILIVLIKGVNSMQVNSVLHIAANRVKSFIPTVRLATELRESDVAHELLWLYGTDNQDTSCIDVALSSRKTVYVIWPRHSISSLLRRYQVAEIERLPWSGAVPSYFLFQITSKYDTALQCAPHDVDFQSTVNAAYSFNGLSNCQCYDCSYDHFIRTALSISSYEFENLCRVSSIESISDVLHL